MLTELSKQKLTFAGLGLIQIFQSETSLAHSAVGLSRTSIYIGALCTVVKGSSDTVLAGSLVSTESIARFACLAGQLTRSCACYAITGALYNMTTNIFLYT